MAVRQSFPTRGVLRRPQWRPVDFVVGAGILALLYGVLRLSQSVTVPFEPSHAVRNLSTDPARLPGYAFRSLSRMFMALGLSVGFTLVYGNSRGPVARAEKILIPALDILQSVPILGFLSITVSGVHRVVPGLAAGVGVARRSSPSSRRRRGT